MGEERNFRATEDIVTDRSILEPSPQSLRRHALSLSILRKGNDELLPSLHISVGVVFTET
jgi:hypothetical protein